MKYSASQAAAATGKAIPTITRAIKSGKISAEKTESGGYLIEPAELHRVYPPMSRKGDETPTKLGYETPNDNGVLQAKLEAKDEQIALLMSERDELRRRLDQEGEERRRLTMMLTDQRPAPAPVEAVEPLKRRWWPWGRAND